MVFFFLLRLCVFPTLIAIAVIFVLIIISNYNKQYVSFITLVGTLSGLMMAVSLTKTCFSDKRRKFSGDKAQARKEVLEERKTIATNIKPRIYSTNSENSFEDDDWFEFEFEEVNDPLPGDMNYFDDDDL